MTEAALITGETPIYEQRIPKSIMGAAQMLEELGLQFDIVDCSYELAGYRLVILPDELVVTEEMQEKLDEYVEAGCFPAVKEACHRGDGIRGVFRQIMKVRKRCIRVFWCRKEPWPEDWKRAASMCII